MLKNNLYHIIELDKDAATAEIELNRSCPIYAAHFPGRPITPGVCIIQTATELFGALSGCEYELKEVVNAKFLEVIDPDAAKDVLYKFQKITPLADGHLKLAAVVTAADTVFAKLSLIYEKK